MTKLAQNAEPYQLQQEAKNEKIGGKDRRAQARDMRANVREVTLMTANQDSPHACPKIKMPSKCKHPGQ
jgi:hypothetical protein